MGRKAASGAFYIGAAQGVRIVLTIASTIVVARILTPADYGVIAMVGPVTAFVLLLQNLGLSHAAIQAKTLSHEQSNALFWLNLLGSLLIAVVLVVAAPLVSWFYDEPRTGYVTAASSITVVLTASSLQHAALLARELRFRALAAVDTAAALCAFAATVAAAMAMRSYWALWLGTVAGIVCNVGLLWLVSRWRPTFPIRLAGSGRLVRFGGSITVFRFLNFLSRNIDNVLIGRVWGPGLLGLYDRSYRLMMFPLQNVNAPLSRVMLPILGRLRAEPDRFRRSYLHSLHLVSLVATPAIAVAGATSAELIPFLLGQRWAGAAPIFAWLSLTGLLQPIANTSGWLFIASGRGKALMAWGAVSTVTTIAAFTIGVFWGPVGVAIAYFLSTALRLPLLFWWCVGGTSVRSIDLYAVTLTSLLGAGAAWAWVAMVSDLLSFGVTILSAVAIAYASTFLIHWLTPEGRASVRYAFGEGWRLLAARARP
ncbi:MAG TPA: lipopolysaccharide biosynthesis protein [Allosphingosinicella sp.]|jgi:PST family polysaccharide transporter